MWVVRVHLLTRGLCQGLRRAPAPVAGQFWDDYGGATDHFHYGHDYAGNRTYRDIDSSIYSTNDKDQTYEYDGLHRLATLDRGDLTGGVVDFETATFTEDWTLDALGNWGTFRTWGQSLISD